MDWLKLLEGDILQWLKVGLASSVYLCTRLLLKNISGVEYTLIRSDEWTPVSYRIYTMGNKRRTSVHFRFTSELFVLTVSYPRLSYEPQAY